MFKPFGLSVAMLCCQAAYAETWFQVDGAGINTALSGQHIIYDNGHRQSFHSNGETEYSSGSQPSKGLWRVENDLYCSQWPPQKDWDCYTVAFSDVQGRILFTGIGGDQYFGRFTE